MIQIALTTGIPSNGNSPKAMYISKRTHGIVPIVLPHVLLLKVPMIAITRSINAPI